MPPRVLAWSIDLKAMHIPLDGSDFVVAALQLTQEFLDEGSVKRLDLKPLEGVKLPRFELPDSR